jgi:hypothetical protein
MKIIHSIENIGGTTLFPGNLVVALDGFKQNKATPVLMDMNSILTEVKINAPTFTRIGVIANKESLSALEVPTNNPKNSKHYLSSCYHRFFGKLSSTLKISHQQMFLLKFQIRLKPSLKQTKKTIYSTK